MPSGGGVPFTTGQRPASAARPSDRVPSRPGSRPQSAAGRARPPSATGQRGASVDGRLAAAAAGARVEYRPPGIISADRGFDPPGARPSSGSGILTGEAASPVIRAAREPRPAPERSALGGYNSASNGSLARAAGEPQPKAFEKLGAAKAFQTREERWREEKFQLSGRPEPGEGEVTVVIEYCFNVRDRERAGGQVSTAHDESRYREEAELVHRRRRATRRAIRARNFEATSPTRASPPAPPSLR